MEHLKVGEWQTWKMQGLIMKENIISKFMTSFRWMTVLHKMLLARMCWRFSTQNHVQTKLNNWKLQTISVRSLHSILIAYLLKSHQTGECWGKKSLWIPLIFIWTHFTQLINQIHHELALLVVARIVITPLKVIKLTWSDYTKCYMGSWCFWSQPSSYSEVGEKAY